MLLPKAQKWLVKHVMNETVEQVSLVGSCKSEDFDSLGQNRTARFS